MKRIEEIRDDIARRLGAENFFTWFETATKEEVLILVDKSAYEFIAQEPMKEMIDAIIECKNVVKLVKEVWNSGNIRIPKGVSEANEKLKKSIASVNWNYDPEDFKPIALLPEPKYEWCRECKGVGVFRKVNFDNNCIIEESGTCKKCNGFGHVLGEKIKEEKDLMNQWKLSEDEANRVMKILAKDQGATYVCKECGYKQCHEVKCKKCNSKNFEKVYLKINEMNRPEMKKELYRQKPIAKRNLIVKVLDPIHKYITTMKDGTKVEFAVPESDMGDAKFEDEMPAQHLIRWMI